MRGVPEIDELVEDVSDIGLRFDVVELARLNQRSDAGPVFSPLVMPSKQRILAIEHGGPDTALDNVRVKFDAAIVQEAGSGRDPPSDSGGSEAPRRARTCRKRAPAAARAKA